MLFAVDYEQKPFGIVRATGFRNAISITAGFLAMPVDGQNEWRSPSPDEIAKFGSGSDVELAAVPLA